MADLITKVIELKNLNDTTKFGKRLGKSLRGGEVIEMSSDLGGGKTTLIKAIVAGTGSKDSVSSPSFTLCNQYKAKDFTIYHFDFYRLNDPGIMKRELDEVLSDPKAVVLIEWPALIEDILPERKLGIQLIVGPQDTRTATLTYHKDLSRNLNVNPNH